MEMLSIQLSTVALAIFFGAFFFVVAKHLQIPAIVPLLIGGVLLGPEVLGIINTASLGDGLRIIISVCVAIILFEGGLTLNRRGYGKASQIIWRLLTIGVLITWLGTAALAFLLLDFTIPMSLLTGSLIIVTGPTVIAPLLKRIKVRENLHQILNWEGVLIDPIGVFIAVLCFEWMVSELSVTTYITLFSLRLLVGLVIGLGGGLLIEWLLERDWIPENQTNSFVLASAIALFALSDLVMHEAGIMTVVIAGMLLGWKQQDERLKNLIQFKNELTEISIGFLFILLAANLQMENFIKLHWQGALLLAGVIFLIRPLSIFASAYGTTLTLRERLFLSWIAPRGIIAGSMASLFAIQLTGSGKPEAAFLEAFAYSVIGATIFFQGLSGGLVARILGVRAPEKTGWLIVGAHFFSRRIAHFLTQNAGVQCYLADTNPDAVREANTEGLNALCADALSRESMPEEVLANVGYVLALTDNRALNRLICDYWSEFLPDERLYRWSAASTSVANQPKAHGKRIWKTLKRPSRIAYDLQHHGSLLSGELRPSTSARIRRAIPLMAIHGREILFTSDKDTFPEGARGLYLTHHRRNLYTILPPDNVLDIRSDQFEVVMNAAFASARKSFPGLPESIRAELLTREHGLPAVLSNGIAIPHSRCQTLSDPMCILARVDPGIAMEAHDGSLTRLFFVLISSVSDPESHLLLLSEVARLAADPTAAERLLNASSHAAIIDILHEAADDE